ncbi:ABC-three component system middle component 1 [Aliarcobacter vitoriensis]|uniref:ABC-three component system middle component 1 n=1 Tax=Aliarcobacter vitoriensis TaxID=2011099 RepID=UPI003AB0F52C
MIDRLSGIFQDNGFQIFENNDDLKILKRNDNKKFEYFLLVQLTNLTNILEEKQLQYLKTLKDKIKDKEVDKNTTLVICFKSETLPLNSEIYKQILKIEEDPYFFRKLVLPYTQQQVGFLDNPDTFKDVIKDTNSFERFKVACKNKDLTSSQYEIVSQLYIKLPFFKLPIISDVKNIVLDDYKRSLDDIQKKTLSFLEEVKLDEIVDNENFFKSLEDLK